jgi:hypothetical protein
MCFALFFAAGSFFLGQAEVFPEPLRRSGLLAVPVVLVLALMFYWLARGVFPERSGRSRSDSRLRRGERLQWIRFTRLRVH